MKKKIFVIFTILLMSIIFYSTELWAFSPSDSELINGIDVSQWQEDIDFEKVANDGIEIVYIKATEGTNYIDPYFREYYNNAKENNLKIGFYHYLTARTEEEARNEANFFVSTIANTIPECRLAMDFESFGDLNVEQINNISEAFLEEVINLSQKEVVIYSDSFNAREVFSLDLAQKYPIWIAEYGVNQPSENGKWSNWIGFQYTDKGTIDGINGFVDRDYFTKEIFISEATTIPERDKSEISFSDFVVKRGDTLSQIATLYNTTYQYLAKINNIQNPNLIFTGQIIKVPNKFSGNVNDTSHSIYLVRRGNTLTYISKLYNVSIQSIVELNNIQNPNLIFTGEILRIPVIGN